MAFKLSRRSGRYWDDAMKLNSILEKYDFHTTGSKEREFEMGFASTLSFNKDDFNSEVITQTNKGSKVESVRCFGKNHRPDMALDPNGIAIELKYTGYSGLTSAIGQAHIYRLQYRFVFIVLIISAEKKKFYEDLHKNSEKPLEQMLQRLADEMNIFTYIVPSFDVNRLGKAIKNRHIYFEQKSLY